MPVVIPRTDPDAGVRRYAEERLPGHVQGRIWVEDKDYTLCDSMAHMVHQPPRRYDSTPEVARIWGPGWWLPAYVYTEESNMGYLVGTRHLRFKGQTRLWGAIREGWFCPLLAQLVLLCCSAGSLAKQW